MGSPHLYACSCTWQTVTGDVPVMLERNPDCRQHGDGTDWWARTQDHARDLSARHHGRDA